MAAFLRGMKMIRAVLFDCDGLMFETERISITMWKSEARRYGVQLPDDFFTRITGAGKADSTAYMNSIPGLAAVREKISAKRFNLDFWRSCAPDSLNKPGLVALTRYLEENGYLTAVCSSSPAAYVKTLLSTVSVPLHYHAMITGDMVSHAKPDPEIFLRGAQALHTAPEECLVLEDSKAGLMAAERAGMHSCWIPDMIMPDDEMKKYIEYQKENLFQVEDLLEELNGGKKWNTAN